MDYLDIGPVPANESCQQVGTKSYDPIKARAECKAFVGCIRRALGNEPLGAHLGVKSNSHDFGSYYEVVCYFDDSLPEAMAYAFKAESDAPQDWDAEARKELGL